MVVPVPVAPRQTAAQLRRTGAATPFALRSAARPNRRRRHTCGCRLHTHARARTHTHMHIHARTRTHSTHTHTHTHTLTHTHTRAYTCTHTHTNTHTCTRTHRCAHACTSAHKPTQSRARAYPNIKRRTHLLCMKDMGGTMAMDTKRTPARTCWWLKDCVWRVACGVCMPASWQYRYRTGVHVSAHPLREKRHTHATATTTTALFCVEVESSLK